MAYTPSEFHFCINTQIDHSNKRYLSTMNYIGSDKHKENLKTARINANHRHNCQHCQSLYTTGNLKKHEASCYLNPSNIRKCPVCDSVIKNYRTSITCSYSCANKLTKTGPNNGNWKEDQYRTSCFYYHQKKCVACEEVNIVTVHHLDENHQNNSPDNLIPLCPTHHQYWHSRFKHLVEPVVTEYITKWKADNPNVT